MRGIRLCDDAELSKVHQLCEDNGLGIEIQGFYNPNLINTEESDRLLSEYKNALANFKGGKSLHAPFWDLNLGSKNPDVRKATMKAFNYAYKIAKELGYIPGRFTWFYDNIQIYDRHINSAKEMLDREPVDCNPYFTIDENVTWDNIMPENVHLNDYPRELIKKKNPQMKFDLGI